METKINWNYPPPTSGWSGAFDKFIGPGATPAEIWLQVSSALALGLAVLLYAVLKELDWSPIQTVVAVVLAIDLAGGIITNATASAKRWYHRSGQGIQQHLAFVSVHVVHIWVVAWLFRAMDLWFFTVWALYLLGATVLILRMPLYLQRPVALGLVCIAFLIHLYLVTPLPGLEWFIPFLFIKLLISHLLREEPYRPADEG